MCIRDSYSSAQKDFLDVILGGLWAQEDNIRSLGFYGSDFPAERLYWSILMLFTSYCSRNSSLLLRLKSQDLCEIRPDGGKYFIMAADASTPLSQLEPRGWNDFYGICSDFCESGGKYESYYWPVSYTHLVTVISALMLRWTTSYPSSVQRL